MMLIGQRGTVTAFVALAALAACEQPDPGSNTTALPRAQPAVRAAHEAVSDPGNTFVDELGLEAGVPIDHPGVVHPGSDDFPTGPAIGERLPDFTLPNQHGETIDFGRHHQGQKAVLIFYRSAVW
ncbi:MAG TPA: hypothetical protein QGG47_12870 [Acidobacteriota bacterium]|nr:hypothetical protein [Acidobacteriota bacterium]